MMKYLNFYKNAFSRCNRITYTKIGMFLLASLCLIACEDFVELDPPKNLLISQKVYEDQATVESALADIYFDLRDQGLLYGGPTGLSSLMGSYADELTYLRNDLGIPEWEQHNLIATDSRIKAWWVQVYTTIYAANAIIEGVNQSATINDTDKDSLKGQALFVRAFLHSLLVNLFGDIPYISTTDYSINNIVGRDPEVEVYSQITTDLEEAISLLNTQDTGKERVIPDQTTAKALLARIYLYRENWEQAEKWATEVIQTPGYQLESDITKSFL